jgi:hypothetical protein
MEKFIQNIYRRRRFAYLFLFILAFACSLTFFIVTVNETKAFGKLLPVDRYQARMNDSYIFSIVIFLLITLPLSIPINLFFKRYIKIIETLSVADMERLEKQNETAPFFNQYLPGYIIKDKSVVFFKFLNTTEIQFMDVKTISLSKVRGGYYITIQTTSSTFFALMAETLKNLSTLIHYASQINKGIAYSIPSTVT